MHRLSRLHACLILGSALLIPGLAAAHTDTGLFNGTAFVETPEIIDCTLENGTETKCHQITVGYLPEGLEIGPFCPATLDDDGGVWDWTGDDAGLYRINRDFLMMLDDLGYRFFDDDGTVHIVNNATQRPEDDHACINVTADESVVVTMLLPVEPVMAQTPTDLGTVAKVGVALDGVPIFADAPSIQQTGHMPALDVCGGHIDPGGWYHWHATATDIETVFERANVAADCALPQDTSAMFGYAFDGFAIYGSTDADGSVPGDLDACNGHLGVTTNDPDAVYHYHASATFPNLPACLVGVQAEGNFSTTASAGIGAANGGGGPGQGGTPPGLDEAAATLGVTPDALMQALAKAGGPPPDFAAAAAALGISADDLEAALPAPPR